MIAIDQLFPVVPITVLYKAFFLSGDERLKCVPFKNQSYKRFFIVPAMNYVVGFSIFRVSVVVLKSFPFFLSLPTLRSAI